MLSLSIMMGLMCLMGNNAEAQVVCNDTVFPFLETFDGGVDSLVCWQPLEGSNWQLIQPGTGSGNGPNKSMVSSSEYANVDSWIVSKAIALPADTTVPLVLSWDVSATHYLTYYYRYFVLVSTGDWTDRTSYDTVYADSSMQVYCGNENTNFENRMVNLDAYHGQVIHVAFCNHPLYADPYEGHWMRLNIDNVEVRDGNAPRVALELPDHVYSGDNITFAATLIEGNRVGMSYRWLSSLTGMDVTDSTGAIDLIYPFTGIDTVTVVAANAYGADTATAVVSVLTHPLPQVSLPVPQQVMTDDTVVYTAVVNECSPYGLAFHWHSSLTGIIMTTTIPTINMVYSAAGIDTVMVVVSNFDGVDTATVVVEVLNCNGTLVPYVEDFDGVHATGAASADGELPPCWEGMTTGSNAAYAPHVINVNGYQYMNFLPSYALLMVAGSEAGYGDVEQVTLPRFSQPLQGLAIAFDYRFESANRGVLSVGYVDSADAFVPVANMTPHAGSYRRDTVYLDSVTDSYARLALRWSYNASYFAVAIDNVEVFDVNTAGMQPMVALEVPDEVSIYNTVVYRALLQGDEAGVSYRWQSSLLGIDAPNMGDTLSVVYTAMGVDTVTVTASNAFGSSTSTAIITIGNCGYRSVPYFEDFEEVPPRVGNTAGHLPECWSSRWTGAAYATPYVNEDGYEWNSTKKVKIVAGSGTNYGNGVATVVLPGFEYPVSQLSLALDYYREDYYGILTVGYLVDTVYTPVDTLNFYTNYRMFRHIVDFSGIAPWGARMAVRYENNAPWATVYIDNIEVFLSSQTGAPPVVTLDGPAVATRYEPTLMTAHLLQGDTAGLTYTWHSSLLDASWILADTTSLTLAYNIPGTDTLTVTATNAYGSDSAVHYLTVVDNIQVAIVGASTTWVGDTMHYVATITGTDTDAFTYTWHSSLLDTTIVTFNPRLTLTYPAAGTDNLTLSFAEGTAVYSATLVIAVQAPCGIIESFPYFEGFEGYGWENREACWQMRLRRGDYMFNHWRRSTSFYYEGEYGFYSTANQTEGGADAWLITPAIELPADSIVLLDFFLQSSYLSNFTVLLSPTGDSWYDAFTDTLYRESGGGYHTPWNSITLSLQNYRGRHVRMAFVHSGPASLSAVTIDNIMLRCQPNNDTIPDTVWHSVTVNRRCHNCYEDIPDDYVTGEGVYQDGSTVTLEGAVHGCSLSFDFWTDEVGDTIFDNPYSFVITSDRTLTAWFGMYGGIGEEDNGKLKVEIYPNPAGNTVTIRANDDSPLRMAVMDMNGRVVLESRQDTSVPIDVSQLLRGAYFVRITTDEGTTVKKLIVK